MDKWDRALGPLSDAGLQEIFDRRLPVLARHVPSSRYTFADLFEERAAQYGDAPFLIDGERRRSWAEVEVESRCIAHAVRALGLGRGDTCAIMLQNRIEYVTVMLGLVRAGVVAALLNTSIGGAALEHAVRETKARALIVGSECLASFAGVAENLPRWVVPDAEVALEAGQFDLLERAGAIGARAIPAEWRAAIVGEDVALYIFTSGTTGLPKAAILSHMRWLMGAEVKVAMMGLDDRDVFYCFLPMFHGAVAMSLFAAAVSAGGGFVIRRRFSASRFWDDVRAHGVTTCQYVGEICRYLMNAPARPDDRDHSLRAITGTGMSHELWGAFQQRFGIPQIYEGWGSTECNTSLVNYENVPGAVGRVINWKKTNLRLVRYDVETDTHPRDVNGHMILCAPGEAGEAIAKINRSPDSGGGRFEGYTSAEASERKILRDVFVAGDEYWSSGDLLRCEASGHCFFVDRIGDTFRWKSENVSTQEVADLLGDLPGLEMVNIYGVKVPGAEGRAGMAAVIMREDEAFDPAAFYALASARLAPYAVPLFVRVWGDPDFTASYKLRKVDLQREGFDRAMVSDPLFVIDRELGCYVPLTPEAVARATGVALTA
ncbi:long-chain-acyl-CoA synthetase [uncultured Sphingomonas sp.]|uniref:long-chain-acyl-CoA synthetase n=1 Tax=uncultured Sphingomonas sp. TaxID=158754 RepID=UPI00261821AE|nr:long-chain-acyl-CoA synthetase [uncultured Sphingomonas sp.]